MQTLTSIVALVVLALGFLQAPFSHMHAGGHSHPVDSFFHLHASGSESASLTAPQDEPAIYLDWGATPQTQLQFAMPMLAADSVAPQANAAGGVFVPAAEQFHGPPRLRELPPRAPPV